ncbi:hypothetical protein BC628DRAFT_1339017 [Trametes gibbosa]|nr:hypothetical protein BC628DRAFT_1339017 [Trametes gibbosa]
MPQSQGQTPAKDPRTAVVLEFRAPISFPRGSMPLAVSRGVQSSITTPLRRPPLLVERDTSGTVESSDEKGPAHEEEGGKGAKRRKYIVKSLQLEADSRYTRQDSYKPGDHAMVKDWVIGRGYICRHGVVADFIHHPNGSYTSAELALQTADSSIMNYAVTYDFDDEEQTAYFSSVRYGILYDKLRSAAAARK